MSTRENERGPNADHMEDMGADISYSNNPLLVSIIHTYIYTYMHVCHPIHACMYVLCMYMDVCI